MRPYGPIESTLLLRMIPREHQGAVFGARSALINLTGPLGVALGSVLMQIMSPGRVIALSAIAVLFAGLLPVLSKDLRALRNAPIRCRAGNSTPLNTRPNVLRGARAR